jgi:methyltransferase (TIGR00027 family)
MQDVARTALMVAAFRAKESNRPNRLFDDPLSSVLAGENALREAANHHRDERLPYLAIRTRFFDDWLEKIVSPALRQIVFLGAGMDTRAFRSRWPDGVQLWEIDCPELLDLKQTRLNTVQAKPKCLRTPVPADLSVADWPYRLLMQGFHKEAPSAWLAEGLFLYLPSKAVAQILQTARSISCAGSQFGAEILSEDYLHHHRARLEEAAARGTPWVFGTNEPAELFSQAGWRVNAVVQPGDEEANFGRWPQPSAPRHSPGLASSFFVTATRDSVSASASASDGIH